MTSWVSVGFNVVTWCIIVYAMYARRESERRASERRAWVMAYDEKSKTIDVTAHVLQAIARAVAAYDALLDDDTEGPTA